MPLFRGSKNATIVNGEIVATAQDIADAVNDAIAAKNAAELAETGAQTAETNAETAETNAETAETNAETAESGAVDAQSYAQEWANKAEDSLVSGAAGGDGVDDFSALHHANKASASASAASTSESNAAASETNAQQAATDAETALDTFTDQYLGAKASDPTTDNDGDPLQDGALYFNNTDGNLRIYSDSLSDWVVVEIRSDSEIRSLFSAAGDLTYNSSTGEFSVTTYKSGDFDTDFGTKDTDDLAEGTGNLYYTDTRARGAVSASGDLSYNPATGVFSFTETPNYTDADVDAHLTGGTGVIYNAGNISIGQDVGTTSSVTFSKVTADSFDDGNILYADDYASLSSAISAAVSQNKWLILSANTTYSITSRIDANLGAGQGIKIFGNNATVSGNFSDFLIKVNLDGEPNDDVPIVIRDLRVENTGGSGLGFYGTSTSTGSPKHRGEITNVYSLGGFGSQFIRIENFRNLSFYNCSSKSDDAAQTRGSFIVAGNDGQFAGDIVCHACEFTQTDSTQAGAPLFFFSSGAGSECRGCHLTDCYIYNAGTNIEASFNSLTADIYFTGCQWDAFTNGDIGVKMYTFNDDSGGVVDNIGFTNCYFQQGNNIAIQGLSGGSADTLKNVTITNSHFGGIGGGDRVIDFFGADSVIVQGNMFEDITANLSVLNFNDDNQDGAIIATGNLVNFASGTTTGRWFQCDGAYSVINANNMNGTMDAQFNSVDNLVNVNNV